MPVAGLWQSLLLAASTSASFLHSDNPCLRYRCAFVGGFILLLLCPTSSLIFRYVLVSHV